MEKDSRRIKEKELSFSELCRVCPTSPTSMNVNWDRLMRGRTPPSFLSLRGGREGAVGPGAVGVGAVGVGGVDVDGVDVLERARTEWTWVGTGD